MVTIPPLGISYRQWVDNYGCDIIWWMTPILIKKLSLLILLLQQLVTQLGQAPPPVSLLAPIPPPVIVATIPTITKVEPTEGGAGTRITITGVGFTPKGNIVYTGVGQLVVASPDGKTLSFTLPRPPFLTDKWLSNTADYRRKYYPEINFPLGFYVKNQNGITAKPGLFSLII
ncbi:MAG: IPT/TIG domain-containing protein [Candidatus Vogelbacteria bacterium]